MVVHTSLKCSAAALLLLAPVVGCSKPETPSGSVPPPVAAVANVSPTGGPGGRFTGSESCRECHTAEFNAWAGSRHRAALKPWDGTQPLRLASAPSVAPYRVATDGTVEGPGPDGKPVAGRVAFLIGGRHREDALVRLADGRIQVFPISFDLDRGVAFEPLLELAGGKAPPPDVVDFWTRVGRNADLACYGCHATGQRIVVEGVSPAGLTLPGSRWVEPGVGCEGCHGPGGPHVDAARTGRADSQSLKMRTAGPALVDGCAACHGLRDVLASPFSDAPAQRYGGAIYDAAEPLMTAASNFEFHEAFFDDLRPATYQQEAIAFSQSGCARKGGLTCNACHDPHSGAPSPALSAGDGGDALCATCHEKTAALGRRHTLHDTRAPGGRCLDCHMASIVRGPARLPARDHSLAPPVAEPGKIPAACAACHSGAKDAAVAAAAWNRVHEGPAARRRREIGLAVEGAETPKGLATLVRIAADPAQGWFLRWAAMQRISGAVTARRTDALAAMLREALSDPNPALRRAAARGLGRFGRPTDVEALAAAKQDPDPWTALAAAHALLALGAPQAGAFLEDVASRPDLVGDARAQYALGHAALLARDLPHAETALRRALALNPMMVGAINDLGLCLMGQGHGETAVLEWKRALEINPRFASARQNLEAAEAAAGTKR
jgi:predicted CXXCH cytochrome family protein